MTERQTVEPSPKVLARPALAPARAGVLQRKCACGGTPGSSGECEECQKKRLQRKARNLGDGTQNDSVVPPIVHEVLRSPGQPLDAATRAFMEPRFGHDFSRVRVHTDRKAVESAQSVNAFAYTVGDDVVFGAEQYSPNATKGRQLLAHELTHVVQQIGTHHSSIQSDSGGVRNAGAFEIEAETVARSIVNGGPVSTSMREPAILRKEDAIPVELAPVTPDENKNLKDKGINLPTVSDETWRSIGGIADNAGKKLSENEKNKIKQLLKDVKMPAASPLADVVGTKFLLHDTSAELGAAQLKEQADIGRGPLGKGVSAWVPRDAAATIARPNFYEAKRPSTTEFEKGIDIIKQPDREAALRGIWKVTNAATKTSSLSAALTGQNLTPEEIQRITGGAEAFLKGSDTKVDGAKTGAAWAIGQICATQNARGAVAVAEAGKEKELKFGCNKLSRYLAELPVRAASFVTVEIVQVGVKSGLGNQNTCDPNNPNVKPMPNPPYSDNQYANIAMLYLRAALTVGSFPETTTHFVVDSFDKGHCDPRCFNLMKLYDTIAGLLGHGIGSTYGVKPQYGLKWGTNTIWWNDKICGRSHP